MLSLFINMGYQSNVVPTKSNGQTDLQTCSEGVATYCAYTPLHQIVTSIEVEWDCGLKYSFGTFLDTGGAFDNAMTAG